MFDPAVLAVGAALTATAFAEGAALKAAVLAWSSVNGRLLLRVRGGPIHDDDARYDHERP